MDSDLKAAGPPPAYGSEMYIALLQKLFMKILT